LTPDPLELSVFLLNLIPAVREQVFSDSAVLVTTPIKVVVGRKQETGNRKRGGPEFRNYKLRFAPFNSP
jgi:hypothetical protein